MRVRPGQASQRHPRWRPRQPVCSPPPGTWTPAARPTDAAGTRRSAERERAARGSARPAGAVRQRVPPRRSQSETAGRRPGLRASTSPGRSSATPESNSGRARQRPRDPGACSQPRRVAASPVRPGQPPPRSSSASRASTPARRPLLVPGGPGRSSTPQAQRRAASRRRRQLPVPVKDEAFFQMASDLGLQGRSLSEVGIILKAGLLSSSLRLGEVAQ